MGTYNVRALAFDHYNTIVDKLAIKKTIDGVFPGHGATLSELWFRKLKEYCWLSGLMERYRPWDELTEQSLTYACKALSLDVPKDLHRKLMDADLLLPPFPEVPQALATLASRYSLVVLTMASAWMVERSLEHTGLRKHFQRVISGESIKTYKPSKRVYEMASQELGMPKEQIGFVSGNSFDVIGSKNFGYPTFWLNRVGELLDELDPKPDLITRDLAELAHTLVP